MKIVLGAQRFLGKGQGELTLENTVVSDESTGNIRDRILSLPVSTITVSIGKAQVFVDSDELYRAARALAPIIAEEAKLI